MEGDDMETALNWTNSSSNVTSGDDLVAPSSDGEYEPWQVLVITVICSIIVVGTIVGNLLVCVAVAIVRKLRTPSNLLIVSLAVSDLFVALLDMPFATMYEVMGRWVLGQGVCDTWTSLDVLLCTASILNLCVISVDRYFVITKPFQYAMKRTPIRMLLMIGKYTIISMLWYYIWWYDTLIGYYGLIRYTDTMIYNLRLNSQILPPLKQFISLSSVTFEFIDALCSRQECLFIITP